MGYKFIIPARYLGEVQQEIRSKSQIAFSELGFAPVQNSKSQDPRTKNQVQNSKFNCSIVQLLFLP
jgi:hypothetical protein